MRDITDIMSKLDPERRAKIDKRATELIAEELERQAKAGFPDPDIKLCQCQWCTVEYPEYKQMMASQDIPLLHSYIERIWEHWQMAQEHRDWAISKLASITDILADLEDETHG